MLKVVLLLLLLQTGRLAQASPAYPGDALKKSPSGDYQDLLRILGEKVPGSLQDKASVIDLLLNLLAEIDLPTLCGVIANDTSSRKRNATSHFGHWSSLSLLKTDQLPSQAKTGWKKSESEKVFDITSSTVFAERTAMGQDAHKETSNSDMAVQRGLTDSEREMKQTGETVMNSQNGNNAETVQHGIAHDSATRKENGVGDDKEEESYDKEMENDKGGEESYDKEMESHDKQDENYNKEMERYHNKDEGNYGKEMERYQKKEEGHHDREMESDDKEGKLLSAGDVDFHGRDGAHFQSSSRIVQFKGRNSVRPDIIIHSLPTNTRTAPSRSVISAGRLRKRVFLPRNWEGKVNTDGALPHPTARNRGQMRNFRLSPFDKTKDLKMLRGRARYRVRQGHYRAMEALGQRKANSGVVIKSVAVQRPRAQLYSSALVLGDWARRKARPDFASLGNTSPPAQLNGATRSKETLRGVNDIGGKNDDSAGMVPGTQILMKQKQFRNYKVGAMKTTPSLEKSPTNATLALKRKPVKAPHSTEGGSDGYDSPRSKLIRLPSREPSSSDRVAKPVRRPVPHVTSKRLLRAKGGRVRGKWRRVSKGQRDRKVLLRTGKLRRMRIGMRKRMRMRASGFTAPEAIGAEMKRYRYLNGGVRTAVKSDSTERTNNKMTDSTKIGMKRENEEAEHGVKEPEEDIFETRASYEDKFVSTTTPTSATKTSTVNSQQLSKVEAPQTEAQTRAGGFMGERELNDKVENKDESSSVTLTGNSVYAGSSPTPDSQEELLYTLAHSLETTHSTVSVNDQNTLYTTMASPNPSTLSTIGTRHRDTGKAMMSSGSDVGVTEQQDARQSGLQTSTVNSRHELHGQSRSQTELGGYVFEKIPLDVGQEPGEVDAVQAHEGVEEEEQQFQEGDDMDEPQPQEGDDMDEPQPEEGDKMYELQPDEDDEMDELQPEEGDEMYELQPYEGDEMDELQPQEVDEMEDLQPDGGDEMDELQPDEGDLMDEPPPEEGDEMDKPQPQEGDEMDELQPREAEVGTVSDAETENILPEFLSKTIQDTTQATIRSGSDEWTTAQLEFSNRIRITGTGVTDGATMGSVSVQSTTTVPWTTDRQHSLDLDLNQTTPSPTTDSPEGDDDLDKITPSTTTDSPQGQEGPSVNHEASPPNNHSNKQIEDRSRDENEMLEQLDQSNKALHNPPQPESLHSAHAQLGRQSGVQAPDQASVSDLLSVNGSQDVDNVRDWEHVAAVPYNGNLLETIEETTNHSQDYNQDFAVQMAKFENVDRIASTSQPMELSPNSSQHLNMTIAPSDSTTSSGMATTSEEVRHRFDPHRSQFQNSQETETGTSESRVALELLTNTILKDTFTHSARENSTSALEGFGSTPSPTRLLENETAYLDAKRIDKQMEKGVTMTSRSSYDTGAMLSDIGKSINKAYKTIEPEITVTQTTLRGKVFDSAVTDYVFDHETATFPAQVASEWNEEFQNEYSLLQPEESGDSHSFDLHAPSVPADNNTDASPRNISGPDAADAVTNGLQAERKYASLQNIPGTVSTTESSPPVIRTMDVLRKSSLDSDALVKTIPGLSASVSGLNVTGVSETPGANETELSFLSVENKAEMDAHNNGTKLNVLTSQSQSFDGNNETAYPAADEAQAHQPPMADNNEKQQKRKEEDNDLSTLERTAHSGHRVTTGLGGRTSTAIKLPLFHMPDVDTDGWRTPWTFLDHSRSRYAEKPVARPYRARFSELRKKQTEEMPARAEGQDSSAGRRLDPWKAYNIVVGAEKSGHLNSLLKSSPSTFGQSSPSTFGQSSPSTFSQSPPSAFGQSSSSRFGQSSSYRFGQASPSAFGQSSPSAFGQSSPSRFGQSNHETVPGLVGLTYPVVNYLWNARPWPNHVASEEFKGLQSVNMAASGESNPPRGQRMRKKSGMTETTAEVKPRVQTTTGQHDQNREWGSRFSQGYFGRVFDEGDNFLQTTEAFGPLQQPRLQDIRNADAQTDNDPLKHLPRDLVNTPQILMEENAVYGVKDPYYYEEMDKSTDEFSENLDQDDAASDFSRENSVYSNVFGVPQTKNVLMKESLRETEAIRPRALWRKSATSESARPASQWIPPLASVNMGISTVQDYACPGLFGYYGDPQDCGSFFVCSWGLAYRLHCPPGTLWDATREVCDWAVNVICLDVRAQGSDNAV